jgi:hypothetical protein
MRLPRWSTWLFVCLPFGHDEEPTICDGMPWPARCRWCDLVTEDPDAYFAPPDSDPEVISYRYVCYGSPSDLHEPDDRPRCLNCGRPTPATQDRRNQ